MGVRRFAFFLTIAACAVATSSASAQVNVTQHHNHANRDGLYVDPAFTLTSAPNITRDLGFNGTISGNVYAQPLYVEGGPDNRAKIIVVTSTNNVYALDAVNGTVIWSKVPLAAPITSGLPCGFAPIGIIGTPVIDLATRALFLNAETAGVHKVYSLNVDTGAINAGWPVNVQTSVAGFDSSIQQQRAAIALVNGTVYIPYGGRNGDCGTYKGRVVGIPINNPASVTSYATTANKSGIWGVGGIASDGTNLFVVTGNAPGGSGFGQQESIVRLQAGPSFTNSTANYWAPTTWAALDTADADLGGCGPVLIDVPGATPSQMVLALGKDRNAYLVNRTNLGGIAAPVASISVSGTSNNPRGQAGVTYRTSLGTYFALRASSTTLSAFKVSAANPPVISSAWPVSQNGLGTPFVTSSDGTSNVIVWTVGTGSGDQRLHGYNGDTGAVVYGGGGANELMTGARNWNTGIVARGSIYLANDNKVYAFRLPAFTPLIESVTRIANTYRLTFDNVPGKTFSVYGSTNLVTPFNTWTLLGTATEISAGQYQFDDAAAGNSSEKFYRVTAP